jgi:hypothetical protein
VIAVGDDRVLLRLGVAPRILFAAIFIFTASFLIYLYVSGNFLGTDLSTIVFFAIFSLYYVYFIYGLSVIGHEIVDDVWVHRNFAWKLFLKRDRVPLSSILSMRRGRGFAGREFEAIFVSYEVDGKVKMFPIVLEAYSRKDLERFLSTVERHRGDIVIDE